MMYHAHELVRVAIAPWTRGSRSVAGWLQRPWNPLSHMPATPSIVAAHEIFEDLTRRYPKPAFNLSSTVCEGEIVEVTEHIVKRKPFAQLKNFRRSVVRPLDPKLLIVAPLSGHFPSLLRETVRELMPDHDVYITDWRDASKVPVIEGAFGLDDYIDYIIDFIDHLGPSTHVLAICQPVVPTLAAVALMAEDGHRALPRSMTLVAGPIDARIDPTEPCQLALKHELSWFRQNLIHTVPFPYPGAMRRVYPGFMQLAGFINMNLGRHLSAYRKFFISLRDRDQEKINRHRDFYNEYLAVMDMPEEYYLDTIQRVFQEFHLARGCFYHRDRRVDLGSIRSTALMTIEGKEDDISSPGQTHVAHDLCSNLPESLRRHHSQEGVGHYGVFSGSRWRTEIAPKLKAFIREA